MFVAVIGAGAAGLCAARHLIASGSSFTCVVYEQSDKVGGTWVYTEDTGKDKYGLPICSAMYRNLRTNLSTENMEFPGFPFLNKKSFVAAAEVLQYLEDYTHHYDIKKHIKFLHHVHRIVPKEDKWEISVTDLLTEIEHQETFDAVIVCNGHYRVPYMGNFPEVSGFEREVMHSHNYRTPEPFKNKTVLICGGGPSGIDICYDLAEFASKVYFSPKISLRAGDFPKNVELVPVVKVVTNDHVIFEDGTTSGCIDTIIICTGYKYSFPFLTQESGITLVEDKYVKPLYKHIINVNHPTMGFIGLLFRSFLFPLFDYQVRFFLKTLTGEVQLGRKEDMMLEIVQEELQKQEQGVPVRKYHQFMTTQQIKTYLGDLADMAQLEHLSPVVYNIFDATANLRKTNLADYRKFFFQRLNDDEYEMSG